VGSDWAAWLALVLSLLTPLFLFMARHWLREHIVRAVQFGFDSRLEKFRAELRKDEEELKSDLRANEAQISALRDGVLSGRAQRQALLDKRKLEAVEHVWSSVVAYTPYKSLSSMLHTFKHEEVSKRIKRDTKLQQFFGELIVNLNLEAPESLAYRERPFVSPLGWAYYSAYSTILAGAFARAKMLSLGVDFGDFLDVDAFRNLLKTALPEYAVYIDTLGGTGSHHQLIDVLEKKLLDELQRTLMGAESDQQNIEQAAIIVKSVESANAELARQKATGAGVTAPQC
jgi:hypothetical protein